MQNRDARSATTVLVVDDEAGLIHLQTPDRELDLIVVVILDRILTSASIAA